MVNFTAAHYYLFVVIIFQVNVGVGAYRCDQGQPFVLPVVREAEKELIMEELDHEYSGIAGCPNFVNLALRFCYGKSIQNMRRDANFKQRKYAYSSMYAHFSCL